MLRNAENVDFFLCKRSPLRQTTRGACNTRASRFQRLVVVKAHIATNGNHGIQCNAVLFLDVRRERSQECHVAVIVCRTRLAHHRVTELRSSFRILDAQCGELAVCRTVREHGAQHHAHLRCHGIVKHRHRFHLVPENRAAVAVLNFLDKAGFGPVGVLALENLACEERLVGGRDFGKRNVVHAERHTEHFLQFLVDADFVCEAGVVGHRKRTAVIRPVTQMSHVKVICIAIDRFNHGVQTFKVGKRKVFDQLYGIERQELCRFIRVELLDFAGTPDFRVTLEVVVYVLRDFRIALRLFQTNVRKRAVAQVLHGAGLQYLAVVHITFHERIACLREFDFALDVFLHHEAELVAQTFHELDAFFVRIAGKAVFAGNVFEFLV